MKTTVDISDTILQEAKKIAAQERTTVKALIEAGLRRVLSDRQSPAGFHLRKATFRGKGLQKGVEEGSWEHIRELVYEGRGE